jgi:hypothetical protein
MCARLVNVLSGSATELRQLETHYSFWLLDMFMSEEDLAVEVTEIDRI